MAIKTKYPNVAVKKASAGLGLFSMEKIDRDQIIIEYTGERISPEEADRRGGLYLFNVTKELVIDGKGRENTARYINHSCNPNAEAEHDEDSDRIYIRSIKPIDVGDEITYDYGKEYTEDMLKKKDCVCRRCVTKK